MLESKLQSLRRRDTGLRDREGAALRSPSGKRYDAVVHCAAAAAVPWSVFRPALAAAGMVVDITPGFVAGATAVLQKLTFSRKRLVPLLVTPRKDEMELLVTTGRSRRPWRIKLPAAAPLTETPTPQTERNLLSGCSGCGSGNGGEREERNRGLGGSGFNGEDRD